MKRIILLLIFLPSFFCQAQDLIILNSGDTLQGKITSIETLHVRITKIDGSKTVIPQGMIKETRKGDKVFEKETAGDNLIEASHIINVSIAIVVIGTVITLLSPLAVVAATAMAGFYVGGVITFCGTVYSLTAWGKIGKAGEILKKHNL